MVEWLRLHVFRRDLGAVSIFGFKKSQVAQFEVTAEL